MLVIGFGATPKENPGTRERAKKILGEAKLYLKTRPGLSKKTAL
jgi:hypothetical protein